MCWSAAWSLARVRQLGLVKKKERKKGGQWHCWLEHGGVALFWTVDQGLVHVFVLHFIWCLYRNPVFSPYSCSYLRWSKLLGMLERCMYLYWYYFVLVLMWPLSSIAATFRLIQTSWNTWKVHVFVLILFCACIVIWLLSCIATNFRLNQTSWNTWKVHVFVLILFWACMDITLVLYCSYLQAEPNFLEHLKGACVCIALLCRVSHMTFPLLILSLNKSDWLKASSVDGLYGYYTLTVTTGHSKQSVDNLVEHSHSFWTGCACCRWLIVLCLPLYMTFPLPLFLTYISLNKRDWLKGTFPLVLDWLLVAGDNNNNHWLYTWPFPSLYPHLYIFREMD